MIVRMPSARPFAIVALIASPLFAQDSRTTPVDPAIAKAIADLESTDPVTLQAATLKLVASGRAAVEALRAALREPAAMEDEIAESSGFEAPRADTPEILLPDWLRPEPEARLDLSDMFRLHMHALHSWGVVGGVRGAAWRALERIGSPATLAFVDGLMMPELAEAARKALASGGRASALVLEAELLRVPREKHSERAWLWRAFAATRSPLSPTVVDEAVATLGANEREEGSAAHAAFAALYAGKTEYATDTIVKLFEQGNDATLDETIAWLALTKAERPGLHAKLLKGLEASDARRRSWSAHAVARCAHTPEERAATLAAFREAAGSRVPELRAAALGCLAFLGTNAAPALPEVVTGLHDRYPFARAAALATLRAITTPSASLVEAVTPLGKDRADLVREEAVRTLGWLGEPALPALLELFRDERIPAEVLGTALRALDKTTVAKLGELAEGDDEHAAFAAALALCHGLEYGDDALETVLRLAKSGENAHRMELLSALTNVRAAPERFLPVWAFTLESTESEDRCLAHVGIARIGAAAAALAEPLAKLLDDAETDEQDLIVRTLEAMGKAAAQAKVGLERFVASDAAQDGEKQEIVARCRALLALFREPK